MIVSGGATGGGGDDGYTAATEAAAVAAAVAEAEAIAAAAAATAAAEAAAAEAAARLEGRGLRRALVPSTPLQTSASPPTHGSEGAWSASGTAIGAALDPGEGEWALWPLEHPDGSPAGGAEWAGVVQVMGPASDVVEVLAGLADGPLDTAQYAILHGYVGDGTGRHRAVTWVCNAGSWTRNESTNVYPATPGDPAAIGVRGSSAMQYQARLIEHTARLLQEDGRPSLWGDASRVQTTMRWDQNASLIGLQWREVVAVRPVAAGAYSVSATVRSSVDPICDPEAYETPMPAAMGLCIGQSLVAGHDNTGPTSTAYPSLQMQGTYRRNGEYHTSHATDTDDMTRAAGALAPHGGSIHRVLVTSALGGQDADAMLSTYVPAAIRQAVRAGWPRVPLGGILYEQGHSDAITEADALAHAGKVSAILAALRAVFGADIPIQLALMQDEDPTLFQDEINAGLQSIAAGDPYVTILDPAPYMVGSPDGTHPNAAGVLLQGQLFAQWMVGLGAWDS